MRENSRIEKGRVVCCICVFLLTVSLLLLNLGCGGHEGMRREEEQNGAEDVFPAGENGVEKRTGAPLQEGFTLHMCGRSVLAGWFEHWGWDFDPANPVNFSGHKLVYHEMDIPPVILNTALESIRKVARAGTGTNALFFKLCYADFSGGDEYSARSNLARNQGIVRSVADAALDANLALVLGNALPLVKEYTDDWLTWNHREYNRFLEELAAAHPGRIVVLDLYGTLASSEGWLRPEYALYPHDSHLNEAAYRALDPVLARVLDEL